MLAAGTAVGPSRFVTVGGSVCTSAQSPHAQSPSTSCVSLQPTAAQHIRTHTLRGSGQVVSVDAAQLPLPLAGHVAVGDSDRVWVTGGYSSNALAPKSLFKIALSTSTPQATAKAAAADAASPAAATPAASEASDGSHNLQPTAVQVYTAPSVAIFAAAAKVIPRVDSHADLSGSRLAAHSTASSFAPPCGSWLWVVWGGLTTSSASLNLAYRNTVNVFDLTGANPRVVPSRQTGAVPSPRAAAALVAINDCLLLNGGRRANTVFSDSFVGRVSIAADGVVEIEWTQLCGSRNGAAPAMAARAGHHAFVLPGNLVGFAGGFHLTEAGQWRRCTDAWQTDYFVAQQGGGGATSSGGRSPRTPATVPAEGDDRKLTHIIPADIRFALMGLALEDGEDAFVAGELGLLILKTAAHGGALGRFLRWGSAAFSPQDRHATPPPERDANLVLIVNHASSPTPHRIVLQRAVVTLDSLKKNVMRACGIDRNVLPDDVLIDFVAQDGQVRPLHLPDILHNVLLTHEGALILHVAVEEPPRNFQTFFGDPIGKGTFGTVYKAINQRDNTSFCLKRVKVDHQSPNALRALEAEIRMMRQLRHENLVKYLGSQLTGDKMYIFMEYVPGDTLEKLCRSIQMTTRQIQMIVRQVLKGLAFLHSYSVVHRDIKGANVLFDSNGVVKVSDFGTAKHLNPLSTGGSNRPAGTILYMAPEIMRGDPCYTAADIWSLGCLIIEMAAGKHPYHERNFTDGIQVVNAVGVERYLPKIPARVSDDGKAFILSCLQFEPNKRPTAKDLLEHPFVTQIAPEEPTPLLPTVTPLPSSRPTFVADDTLQGTTTPLVAPSSGARPAKLKPKAKPRVP